MNLLEQPFLFLDGQTTGMRPPQGQLLEFSWSIHSGDEPPVVASQIFGLPAGTYLNKKISEITGLRDEDLAGKPDPKTWFDDFFVNWTAQTRPPLAIVHCAQFEKPFLQDLMNVPFDYLCTQQLTRKLFPTLPSQNIRAVSGYFGHPITGPNRAGEFVFATMAIWRGLAQKAMEMGLNTLEQLLVWQKTVEPAAKKKKSISYRIPTELRLKLPDRPGIYRMIARNGEVLYVGKATSLKSRVNSYFRGVKNRDRRKLEMLAQVWDLQVEECGSPLESALRETDEIKRLNPPYNISLKKNQRQLCFYSADFLTVNGRQSEVFPMGPFRPGNFIDMVIKLHHSIQLDSAEFEQIFFDPIDPEILEQGFKLFLLNHKLTRESVAEMRGMLAYGLNLFRHYEEAEKENVPESDAEADAEIEVTPEYVAGKFERLLRRAGGELVRAKKLTAALNSNVEFLSAQGWRSLQFRGGLCNSLPQENSSLNIFPWSGLDIETYDRLSVLLSELSRLEHRILRHSPP